jgi:hypothetical protein
VLGQRAADSTPLSGRIHRDHDDLADQPLGIGHAGRHETHDAAGILGDPDAFGGMGVVSACRARW